ncbi:hypothetical protein A2U01_0058857 [Trifolium medium]|uniref:Uncharacterized protein n=1 Tax=Trifolium medium TaxID=97028 RepID=A0A392RLZ0_9FABA|nr:hypothetical protein [Trifolium medium]
MEAASADDETKEWGDKKANNHEDNKKEKTSARRNTEMDPKRT